MGVPFQMQVVSHRKRGMEMNDFLNPSKRIRLDQGSDRNVINDDLWGADDITAEEFDELEIKATQSAVQRVDSNHLHPPCRNATVNQAELHQDEILKQHQFELEGKIKLLDQSLDKITRELKEEKSNKEKLIYEKAQDYQVKENALHKELEKMESALQFKDQEMKSIYDKIHFLEAQLQEKRQATGLQPSQPSEVVKRFKFGTEAVSPSTSGSQRRTNKKSCRRHHLLVDMPEGKMAGSSIISSMFCNRLTTTSTPNPYFAPLSSSSTSAAVSKNCISAITIVALSSNKQTVELFDHFQCIFESYLTSLKNAASVSASNSPSCQRRKEPKSMRVTAIQGLKDLACLLSCSEFLERPSMGSIADVCCINQSERASGSSSSLCAICDKTALHAPLESYHSLLKTLVSLASPNSYPSGLQNDVEIELSLFCLVSWSSHSENLIQFAREIPFPALISPYSTSSTLCLIIELLANLCHRKESASLVLHSDGSCILCAISSVAFNKMVPSPLEFSSVFLRLEDFLSSLFTSHSFLELKLESKPCPSLVLQGIVMTLWRFQSSCKKLDENGTLILKKGISLIHLLSRYFPEFKDIHSAFEDTYVSLVSGGLKLCKENPRFRELQDLIHNLWDFQDDATEFDADESSQDSSNRLEQMSQSNL